MRRRYDLVVLAADAGRVEPHPAASALVEAVRQA
jgi:hypothetical protein